MACPSPSAQRRVQLTGLLLLCTLLCIFEAHRNDPAASKGGAQPAARYDQQANQTPANNAEQLHGRNSVDSSSGIRTRKLLKSDPTSAENRHTNKNSSQSSNMLGAFLPSTLICVGVLVAAIGAACIWPFRQRFPRHASVSAHQPPLSSTQDSEAYGVKDAAVGGFLAGGSGPLSNVSSLRSDQCPLSSTTTKPSSQDQQQQSGWPETLSNPIGVPCPDSGPLLDEGSTRNLYLSPSKRNESSGAVTVGPWPSDNEASRNGGGIAGRRFESSGAISILGASSGQLSSQGRS